MITKLRIKGFKSFDDEVIELNNFSLLVGMNSAGKSTAIQAVLLAIQNVSDDGRSPLNGRLISLGEFSDARNFITNAKRFIIILSSANEEMTFSFYEDDGVVKCEISGKDTKLYEYLNQKKREISYLSSKRIGAEDIYNKNFDKYNDYGIFGEYAIAYYETNKQNEIEDYLIKDKTVGITLGLQLNYWLKYIVNSELETENIADTDHIKARYKISDNRAVRPKNIGSGLSYIISILISSLTAKKDELIIIENPEIHLHPKAQARLTEFLLFCSKNGVRFLIETHSDHIFNGVRKAIYKKQIEKKEISVYFFSICEKKMVSNSKKIDFDIQGNVLNHQSGLFDQFDDDLDVLLGLS